MLTLNKKLFVKKIKNINIYTSSSTKINNDNNNKNNNILLTINKKHCNDYSLFLKKFKKNRKTFNYTNNNRKNIFSINRSIWKGPFSKNRGMILPYIKLLRNYNKEAKYTFLQYTTNKHFASIFSNITTKASIIVPEYMGMEHYVYMGERYRDIRVRSDHIGYRFGEFDNTTKKSYLIHRINKKSKTKKKQKK